ncbi:zinc finger CCCH domain-containing protein 14-like isoform X6 [Quercus robur]|uniref:zinc finger CCCH domain-containing protein 14-like isoform X6 n=1 Tax=Quercus robur TaxID=38942 RepID=UPI0021620F63|nr:zinc finger CCCH domain-containing protein 14-like isoform X6 [Quercus robur]
MENDASPPSTTTAASTPPREETVKTTLHLENQNFGTDFASLYHSIFPPKSPLPTTTSISLMSSPSTCSSSIDDAVSSTQNRLNQARLILQYQELNDHYDLCRARLIDLLSEAESLRHENAELRLANAELLKLLSSQASFHNLLLSSSYPNRSFLQDLRRLSTEDEEHSENRTNLFDNRFSLPKSISVRSTGFTKANLPPPPPPPVANTGPTLSRSSTRSRAPPSQLGSASQQQQQRVYMAGKGEEDKEAVELEVYNQGMMKTELCNKWQETGTHCLIRCFLAGDTCPYGHRCHFRHTLTDQVRSFLFAPPPR